PLCTIPKSGEILHGTHPPASCVIMRHTSKYFAAGVGPSIFGIISAAYQLTAVANSIVSVFALQSLVRLLLSRACIHFRLITILHPQFSTSLQLPKFELSALAFRPFPAQEFSIFC